MNPIDTSTNTTPPSSRLRALFVNPVEHRLRGGWRLLVQGFIYFGGDFIAQFIIGIGVALILMLSGTDLQDTTLLQTLTEAPPVRLLTALSSLIFILISCFIAARWLDKRPFRAYGFHLHRRWWADLGFGLFLGAFLMLFIFLVERSAGWLKAGPVSLDGNAWLGILAFLLVYLCVGLTEELLVRGYQTRNLAETLNNGRGNPHLPLIIAYLGSSTFFGWMHFLNPNATLTSTLLLIIAGLFLGLGYILTGELALPIGLHITWNFFQGNVFGFPVSGTNSGPSLVQIEQGGPLLWTGGAFGPEAGLIGLAAIILGAVLILAWVRWTRGKVTLSAGLAVYSSEAAYSSK